MNSVISIWRVIPICLLLFVSCETNSKPPDESKPNETPEFLTDYLGEKVKKDFIGTVKNSDKKPFQLRRLF
jgi:hypothetical protein